MRVSSLLSSIAAAAALLGPAPASAVPTETGACTDCHDRLGDGHHPYDIDYEAAAKSSAIGLRPRDEAIRRGITLVDGKVQCITCHSASSPWRYYLALPTDATPQQAFPSRKKGDASARSAVVLQSPAQLTAAAARGERPAVSPKPMCMACHPMD